jgi:hypothetical protein
LGHLLIACYSYDDLLKDDLVSALSSTLQDNPSTYSSNPVFTEFYNRGGSPVKKERGISVPLNDAADVKPTRRRRTMQRAITKEEEPDSP